ncbi:hypothetical protein AJ80_03984 [Polytolypa hystricis UAMH7299]|uniref:Uncharacterized protein n=1 Tax=Polytolypa hystricis (strain UAMH7299) TaxID=1447883 RepID=A0A2B7Y5A9_POLH7|nr:hypothetical protein AJ80_03984 [Polytolypa hystricis UAMH7299]
MLKPATIQVLHVAREGEEPVIICEALPKALAIGLSAFFKDAFPTSNQAHVSRRGSDGKAYVTICGGLRPAFSIIFKWMFDTREATVNANRNGKKPTARIEFLPFGKYIHILKAAEILDIAAIRIDLLDRMNRMTRKKVPIDIARMVYANFPVESEIRQLLIRRIGDAIYERRLHDWAAYLKFRDKCIEYKEDIYRYLDSKARAIAEARKLWNEEQRPDKLHREEATQKSRGEGKHHEAGDKPHVITKTISAQVVRKGKHGKPSYVTIPLQELGISNDEFSNRIGERKKVERRSAPAPAREDRLPSAKAAQVDVSSTKAEPAE